MPYIYITGGKARPQEAFLVDIKRSRLNVFHLVLSSSYIESLQGGAFPTTDAHATTFPKKGQGFELLDPTSRKSAFVYLFSIISYLQSQKARIGEY